MRQISRRKSGVVVDMEISRTVTSNEIYMSSWTKEKVDLKERLQFTGQKEEQMFGNDVSPAIQMGHSGKIYLR